MNQEKLLLKKFNRLNYLKGVLVFLTNATYLSYIIIDYDFGGIYEPRKIVIKEV